MEDGQKLTIDIVLDMNKPSPLGFIISDNEGVVIATGASRDFHNVFKTITRKLRSFLELDGKYELVSVKEIEKLRKDITRIREMVEELGIH